MDFKTARLNMVNSQIRVNDVFDADLCTALRLVKRERLCAPGMDFSAYADLEPEVSPGRVLMRPRDIAKLIQALEPKKGANALCLAAPYAAAVLAEMGLKVTFQDVDARCASVVGPYLQELRVTIHNAAFDDLAGKYDIIICESAVSKVPEPWAKALAPGGRLGLVLRESVIGQAVVFTRYDGILARTQLFDSATRIMDGLAGQVEFAF